jgi:hypothetical protein
LGLSLFELGGSKMKLYKDGRSAIAEKSQIPALEAAGWSRTEAEVELAPVVEQELEDDSEDVDVVKTKKPAKKIAKRRKAIKKSDSED